MEIRMIPDKDGNPLYALVPVEEYERLVRAAEELADAAAFDAARDQEKVPAVYADRLLDGENPVRVWRQYRGLTQRELAVRVGVTQAHLSEIELGKSEGSLRVMTAIARALEVDLDDLVAPAG